MVKVVKTKVEVEGSVHEETVVVERDEPQVWGVDQKFQFIGKPLNRVDGRQRVTGSARYTYDIQPPGMLYAAVLRCPHPHARLLSVDTSEAEKLPGVRAVISRNDAPSIPWYGGHSSLFPDLLRYRGEEVAAVCADDHDTARDALKLIKAEYEQLEAVTDMEKAALPNAPQIHPQGNVLKDKDGNRGETYKRGDIDKGFKDADVVVEGTYRTPTALHNSFETHGCVTMWEGDELTVWESTQYMFGVRGRVATSLGMPLSKVHVISEFMGGGFGSKSQTLKHTIIAALLSKRSGRPVKLMLDRNEESLFSGNRGATIQSVKLGAKKDGTLTAIDLDVLYNMGAYGMWAGPVSGPAQELYKCNNVRTHTLGVRTNLGTHASFRAPGFVEGTFAFESAIEDLCQKLGMDGVEFRRKNHAANDQVARQDYTAKNLLECYTEVLKLAGLPDGKLPVTGSLGGSGALKRGIGMASQTWSGGGGPPAHALVRINSDGAVEVMCATQDIGTGVKTALSQVVAEELGVPMESIKFRLGDTQKGPFAPASWGSITVPSVGPAVRVAARDAREQLLDIASYFLEVPASRLVLADGVVTIEGRQESKRTIAEILSEVGDYMITGKGFRGPNPTNPLRTWGAQVAEVEVNTLTGRVRLVKMAAVHDIGRVINPKGLASQFQGGILQGMGFSLTEERVVDEESGIVLNDNLQDYKIPTLADAPEMLVQALDKPDLEANHVGSKGAGEPPIIPAPAAIANAIYNAVGVRVTELPVTPRRLLEAIEAQRGKSDA
ncbi:MAG: xanthine dehydrogenase family protein molybdopterin-binding subunit [Chloroflexota bacterium]|nr:xanthine dehydrogenase family protein molybdopterin-binding subunit [Chloroflexota bacterium]